MLNVNTEVEGFKKQSFQDARTELACGFIFSCKGDCWKISCCYCKASGVFFTPLCHNGRGGIKKCTLLEDLCFGEEVDRKEQ